MPWTQQQTLKRLRRELATLPPAEPVAPVITQPALSAPPPRPVPPPGGWPEDAGWSEDAAEHFAHAGEEPQT